MDGTISLKARVSGESEAAARLLPQVYDQLRRLASRYLRSERPGHTLCPTELVHEAYLRLVGKDRIGWQGKTHFFCLAATQMRRVLVEWARARGARKRGGEDRRITLTPEVAPVSGVSFDVLAITEALDRLAALSARQARIVELRFFGGLTVREVALALQVSERTVREDWRVARAWLAGQLGRIGNG